MICPHPPRHALRSSRFWPPCRALSLTPYPHGIKSEVYLNYFQSLTRCFLIHRENVHLPALAWLLPGHRRALAVGLFLYLLLAAPLLLPRSSEAAPPKGQTSNDDASLFAAVCPVVYQLDQTPANRGFHYIFYGNAFFINDQGYLLTAAHVLSEFSSGGQPQILLRLPEAPPRLVKINVIAKDSIHDVAILQATPNPFHTRFQVTFLPLSSQKAAVGDPVIAEALRPSRLKDPHTFDVPREDRVPANVLQYLSTPLDKGQPNAELFLFSHEVQRGQSGAPVVSRDGHQVVGLVEGRWLHPASAPIAGSDGKPAVTQGAAIPISYAITLLDENHISWRSDAGSSPKEQKDKSPNN